MEQKILLDTDVCISILNKLQNCEYILSKISNAETFVSAVTVFELFLRKTNIAKVDDFLKDLNMLNFNNKTAIKSSFIFKNLKSRGKTIDMRDLFIASTAIVNDCVLATLNKKHFENIEGLKMVYSGGQ